MFNPSNDTRIDVTQIWNCLGTVYNEMDEASKSIFETYWKALFNGLEALYFDLVQTKFCDDFNMSPGYLEHGYDIYRVDNTTIISGLSSVVLPLKENFKFLSVPTLSGTLTGEILHEGIDYEIQNNTFLKFFNALPSGELYLAATSTSTLPIMTNLYFPMMGLNDNPDLILNSGYYPPHVVPSGTTYQAQQQSWAFHLWKLMQAIVNKLQRGCTMNNLTDALSLFYNTPFTYYSGIITNYFNQEVTISGSNSVLTYKIPVGLSLKKSLTSSVAPLELLCSGVTIHDYISASGINSSLYEIAGVSGIQEYNTLAVHIPDVLTTLGYCPTSTEFFMNAIVPPNLTIKYY